MIPSYQKIYNVGHLALEKFFHKPVYVQEKLDGSQFSFRKNEDGSVSFRSKGAIIDPDAPPKMFRLAVEGVLERADRLEFNWVYRGEAITKNQHNALCYERTPQGYVVVFDVEIPFNHDGIVVVKPMEPRAVEMEATRLGYESAPVLGCEIIAHPDQLTKYLKFTALLGGPMIEGVVLKRFPVDALFGPDGKLLAAKYVQEAFKEVHAKAWTRGGEFRNHTAGGILEQIGNRYHSEARWLKAIQHLDEAGKLSHSPKDIGPLLQEIPQDIWAEEEGAIKDALFAWAKKDLGKLVTRGFPQFYKDYLLKRQFDV